METAPNLRTIDLARAAGIHVNTVRFYERLGLIDPAPRTPNGYRQYNRRHLLQLLVLREIYLDEWPGRAVRIASDRIVAALRHWDLERASGLVTEYLRCIKTELALARRAIRALANWKKPEQPENCTADCSLAVTARMTGETIDTVRNWERNGLLTAFRSGPKKALHFRKDDLERCRVIRHLLETGFSLQVIARAFRLLDRESPRAALAALVAPSGFDILSSGDRRIEVLRKTARHGRRILTLIENTRHENH